MRCAGFGSILTLLSLKSKKGWQLVILKAWLQDQSKLIHHTAIDTKIASIKKICNSNVEYILVVGDPCTRDFCKRGGS